MTTRAHPSDPLGPLLVRLMDGALSPEENTRLAEVLRGDAAARRRYHDFIELHALLHWEHDKPDELLALEAFDHPLMGHDEGETTLPPTTTGGTPILGFLAETWQRGQDFASGLGLPILFIAAMACGALLTVMLTSDSSRTDREEAAPPQYAAKLGRTVDCQWQDPHLVLDQGAAFSAGRVLKLNAGLAKLHFVGGARILLEGPARFKIDSPRRGVLEEGKLVCRVSKTGVGFQIGTPTVDVVDLGTAFGVSVEEDGTSEVHVFEGVVETSPLDAPEPAAPIRLVRNQAARFAARQAPKQEIVCAPAQFVQWPDFEELAGAARPTRPTAPPGSFSVVVISDTQEYMGCGTAAQPGSAASVTNTVFESYVQWVAENVKKQRIVFVSHIGDMVNKESHRQWQVARHCLNPLHGKTPYGLTVGPPNPLVGDRPLVDEYFPCSHFEQFAWFGGAYSDPLTPRQPPSIVNSYQQFSAEGLDFLALHVQSNPTDEVLRWVDEVLENHADRRAVIFTDAYLGPRERPENDEQWFEAARGRMRWAPGAGPVFNTAQDVWEKCFSKHPNIFMICSADDRRTQAWRRTVHGREGNPVHELLADYGPHGLRVYNFRPRGNKIHVATYSPFMKRMCEKTKVAPGRGQHQFTLYYDMSNGRRNSEP